MNKALVDRIRLAVEKYAGKADYLEVRFEETEKQGLSYRNGELISLSTTMERGANARVLINGGWGFVVFSDLDRLERSIEDAIDYAKLLGGEPIALPPIEPVDAEVPVTFGERNPLKVPLKEKIALLSDYSKIVNTFGAPIALSGASYSHTFTRQILATSEGTCLRQEKFEQGGAIHATATRGAESENAYVQIRSYPDFAPVEGLEEKIEGICRLAVDLLDAPRLDGGKYTVVTDAYMTGTLTHEAFGHLSEAEGFLANPAMQTVMAKGRTIGSDILSIYDAPMADGFGGSYAYDDEGVPSEKTYLIRDGVISGKLHTRYTAARLGEKPTGNARAVSYRYPPISRMRNTFIEARDASFEDLIGDVEDGLHAINVTGGHGGEEFTFTCHHGRRIRDGKLAELVRGCTLSGNLFETLKDIDRIGKDTGVTCGGCGAGGQFPLMVGMGGPPIRIRNVQIGGGEA